MIAIIASRFLVLMAMMVLTAMTQANLVADDHPCGSCPWPQGFCV
jgi:hypothetical protein